MKNNTKLRLIFLATFLFLCVCLVHITVNSKKTNLYFECSERGLVLLDITSSNQNVEIEFVILDENNQEIVRLNRNNLIKSSTSTSVKVKNSERFSLLLFIQLEKYIKNEGKYTMDIRVLDRKKEYHLENEFSLNEKYIYGVNHIERNF